MRDGACGDTRSPFACPGRRPALRSAGALRRVDAWIRDRSLYLALRGGGYDTITYSETGLAVWWIVLVGALAGVLPLSRLGRLAWTCVGLLGALALWMLIATGWSDSVERTVTEVGRTATYLGFFVLGLCVVRRDTIRPLVTGMAAAFGVIGLLGVLSRLYPGAFPANTEILFLPAGAGRLNYPFNYASGTGNFLAMGLPLLLATATRARTIAGRSVAAAAIPVSVLGLVMTASRGGVLTALVGIVCFYALTGDRIPKLATGLATAGGSTILILALLHRSAVRNGLSGPTAISQRHQLVVLLVVVGAGVALVQAGIALAARYAIRPAWLQRRPPAGGPAHGSRARGHARHRDRDRRAWAGSPTNGTCSRRPTPRALPPATSITGWARRRQPPLPVLDERPRMRSSQNRLSAIGPGTFQFYWAQHGSINESIVNAHSLYLETLAEMAS